MVITSRLTSLHVNYGREEGLLTYQGFNKMGKKEIGPFKKIWVKWISAEGIQSFPLTFKRMSERYISAKKQRRMQVIRLATLLHVERLPLRWYQNDYHFKLFGSPWNGVVATRRWIQWIHLFNLTLENESQPLRREWLYTLFVYISRYIHQQERLRKPKHVSVSQRGPLLHRQ